MLIETAHTVNIFIKIMAYVFPFLVALLGWAGKRMINSLDSMDKRVGELEKFNALGHRTNTRLDDLDNKHRDLDKTVNIHNFQLKNIELKMVSIDSKLEKILEKLTKNG